MRQLGAGAREGDLGVEARRVCDEMARRARYNVERIVERLLEQGYRFHTNDFQQKPVTPHFPPTPRAVEVATWLEEQFPAVPLTLLSWIHLVGDVWFVGTHPRWPESAAGDPLALEVEGARYPGSSIEGYFEEEMEAYEELVETDADADPFVLPLAPDRLHKDNTSGGDPYGIVLPDGCVDGIFVAETDVPFVAYLNHVFERGGFPADTGSPHEAEIKRSLADGLLPL
jgi:hypothetical protein